MKIWKIGGCIALLVIVICGCVLLGKGISASDEKEPTPPAEESSTPQSDEVLQTPPEENEENAQTPPADDEGESKEENETTTTNNASVEKPYSEGLLFRSNGDGSCAVAGIGTCQDSCILIPRQSPAGDTVTEILPYAFSGAVVGAIEIPNTVTTLSSASFSGCPRLSIIRVEKNSASFSEYKGALYSADGRTLVFCPMGRGLTELYLHSNVRRIAADALANCSTIKTVHFSGSNAEWQSLIIGDGNDALKTATLQLST